MSETRLLLHGLKCPLPVLRTQRALRTLMRGDTLIVECTDPMTAIDLPVMLARAGDTLVESGRDADVLTFHIRKG